METISVIGIGRLGLCFSMTLESAGYNVVGCDVNKDYVNSINNKTFFSYEPGLNRKLLESKNFSATTDLKIAVNHSNTIFVTVASFSEPDGKYDVSQVDSVVNNIKKIGYHSAEKIKRYFILGLRNLPCST